MLTDFEIARTDLIPYATVGKSLGNLSFESLSPGDHIVMGSGERISVGGNLDIQAVTFGRHPR